MGDDAHTDGEGSDESGEQESWLHEAARVPELPASALLPMPGQILGGKYRIERQLGRGGMGAVFRARHLVSEKSVAIKWMLRAAGDEQAQRRFEREARAAGRIEHPNVVDLYDVCREGDRSYLVMELLHGESLRKRLQRGALAPCDAVALLLPAMHGVAAAHRAGVIHRDLKPDNVFLCQAPDGTPRHAKVVDFGVSSIAAAEGADATLTQDGVLLGSPAYMSPEQLRSAHDVDARTDVYAFGVILYEAIAGQLPFRGRTYSALIMAISSAEPVPLSKRHAGVAPALERVVMRAFAREPAQRHPDVRALIEALQPFAKARGAGLQLGGAGRRIGWLALAAVALSLLLAGWALSRGWRSQSSPGPSAVTSESSPGPPAHALPENARIATAAPAPERAAPAPAARATAPYPARRRTGRPPAAVATPSQAAEIPAARAAPPVVRTRPISVDEL